MQSCSKDLILLLRPSLFIMINNPTHPASTWARAPDLWVITNLVGSGIYLSGWLAPTGGHIAATLRSTDAQLVAALLVVLAALASLPTSLLAKFAYAYTLRRPRRLPRVVATAAALVGLYCLGAGLAFLASAGPQALNPIALRTTPGKLLPLAPYLLGGALGTLIVYRRALSGPDQTA